MAIKLDSGERIAKVISRSGVASRRGAEQMILAGRVCVDGRSVSTPALNIFGGQRITVDGKPIPAKSPPRLWRLHKAAGTVTSARDERGRRTVFDGLPESMPRTMPVGRLDLNSEGLLLLTNCGELKRRLEHPRAGWLRRYRVRVLGRVESSALAALESGVSVEGMDLGPMDVTLDRQNGANAWLTVGLRRGRNREIRRSMEAVGLKVNRLIRLSFGPFELGDLRRGQISEVKERGLLEKAGVAQRNERGRQGSRRPRDPTKGMTTGRPRRRDGAGPKKRKP